MLHRCNRPVELGSYTKATVPLGLKATNTFQTSPILQLSVAAIPGSGLPRRLQVLVGAQFICAMGGWLPPLQSPSKTGLLHEGEQHVQTPPFVSADSVAWLCGFIMRDSV